MIYAVALRQANLDAFIVAGNVFPYSRQKRTAPAYIAVATNAAPEIKLALLYRALQTDPYAADLWFNLSVVYLNLGDQQGYDGAMRELRKLTPHSAYAVHASHQEGWE